MIWLAEVAAPVGSDTVPETSVMFQVPDWVAGKVPPVPVVSIAVPLAAVLATDTCSGTAATPASAPAALRRLTNPARFAVICHMPCCPLVRALLVAVVW